MTSLDGNLALIAGNRLTIAASDIAAGNNLTLAAKDIQLLARQDTQDSQSGQASKSSGFSVGVTYDPDKVYRNARDFTMDFYNARFLWVSVQPTFGGWYQRVTEFAEAEADRNRGQSQVSHCFARTRL